MRLYLDDVRQAPPEWFRCSNAWRCIDILKGGKVTELSLDHDLGNEEVVGNGADVLVWILGAMQFGFKPPERILLHSMNTPAKLRMQRILELIEKLHFLEGYAVTHGTNVEGNAEEGI